MEATTDITQLLHAYRGCCLPVGLFIWGGGLMRDVKGCKAEGFGLNKLVERRDLEAMMLIQKERKKVS